MSLDEFASALHSALAAAGASLKFETDENEYWTLRVAAGPGRGVDPLVFAANQAGHAAATRREAGLAIGLDNDAIRKISFAADNCCWLLPDRSTKLLEHFCALLRACK